MHHPTAFVTPVMEHWLEREIAQWVHPMKDRSDDSSHHEQTLLPRSYISLPDARELLYNMKVYIKNLQCDIDQDSEKRRWQLKWEGARELLYNITLNKISFNVIFIRIGGRADVGGGGGGIMKCCKGDFI